MRNLAVAGTVAMLMAALLLPEIWICGKPHGPNVITVAHSWAYAWDHSMARCSMCSQVSVPVGLAGGVELVCGIWTIESPGTTHLAQRLEG